MKPSLIPSCSFERLDPSDLTSAIQTASEPLSRKLVRIPPLGLGFEVFLRWAIRDLEVAQDSSEHDQQIRFCVSALVNARRSLSCLADQYMTRDCFAFCRDRPRKEEEKADLLRRRGLFDGLAVEALARAVNRRNRVEHHYEPLGLADAQDTVHLIRATIENCVAKSDPYWAPGIFGSFLGGHSAGPEGERHWFHGWSGLMFPLARYDSPSWFGIVVPTSNTDAAVRQVVFSELSCDQLLLALTALEAKSAAGYSGCGEGTFRGQLRCAGLMTT